MGNTNPTPSKVTQNLGRPFGRGLPRTKEKRPCIMGERKAERRNIAKRRECHLVIYGAGSRTGPDFFEKKKVPTTGNFIEKVEYIRMEYKNGVE